MKKIDSRRMTRLFLENITVRHWTDEDDARVEAMRGESVHDIDPDNDGIVSQEDLYKHFDLNGDGKVHTDEYVDHIEYHTENPETLDHYRKDVPCNNSYNSCYSHHNSDNEILRSCISQTGATCMQSGIQALIDVLQSMKQNGII